jgi:TetR/AcrR family transcriptional regulator
VILGPDLGGDGRFEDAARYLDMLFLDGLKPKVKTSGGPRVRSL